MVSKKITYKNGTRVLFAPLKETKAVTALILFPIGSRYEPSAINGSSHFLEHLFFKGTAKRPSTLEVSKELDGVGAEYNAFTGKDHTGYYVKVAADKLELALDILSDMLYRSLFDPAEIERERGVIVEEINMYEDNPMMNLDEVFEQTIFKGNSLGMTIAGPRKVIRTVTRKQLMAYKARFYNPHNLLLTIAGKFDATNAARLAKKYFGEAKGPRVATRFDCVTSTQHAPRVTVKFRKTEQIQMGLGFPAYAYNDPRMPALSILSIILGGNMSSRLFIRIRERLGLCYFIRSERGAFQDTGYFLVRAGLEKTRINEAIKKIWAELTDIRDVPVGVDELTRAKEFIRGKILLGLEDSEEIADWVAKQLLLQGKIETPEQKIEKLMRVTVKDVQAVAKDIIKASRLNLALIGPYTSAAPFRNLVHTLQ
jgi:predicted Zn-dependent peptidase